MNWATFSSQCMTEMREVLSHYMPHVFTEKTTLFSFNSISFSFFISAFVLVLLLIFRFKNKILANISVPVFVLVLLNDMYFIVRMFDGIANPKSSHAGKFRVFNNLMLGYFIIATIVLFLASLSSSLNYELHFFNLIFIAGSCSLFLEHSKYIFDIAFKLKFHGINAYYPCFFFAVSCYFLLIFLSPLLKPFYDRLYFKSYEVVINNPFMARKKDTDASKSTIAVSN